jgi:hypothetical protein
MLEELKWPTLEERRKRARLILMYKIVNGLVKIEYGSQVVHAYSNVGLTNDL